MNIPSGRPTPPKNSPSPTAFSSPPSPHPPVAPPAQSPSPSRNHHAHPRSPPRAHRNASQMFSALPVDGYSETIPVAPSIPPPGFRSWPDASPPTLAIRLAHPAEKDFRSADPSSARAPHIHDYSALPPPARCHTSAPALRLAAPTQKEENAHAVPRTAIPYSARSPAHKRNPL